MIISLQIEVVKSEGGHDSCVFTRFLRLLNFPNFSREIAVFNSQAVQNLRVFTIFFPVFWIFTFFQSRAKPEASPKKDKIEGDDTKVEEPEKEETASGSSWWGSYTSMLNKAVDSVSTAVDSVNTVAATAVDSANTIAASAVVSAKQKVKFVKLRNS